MDRFKLHDLRCFEAVARERSFQAAARTLNRSHPSVFAAVARLEARLSLVLLDRSGYRVEPTAVGVLFLERARLALREVDNLQLYGAQLASGEETVVRVVIGDLCPRASVLRVLGDFFRDRVQTRLHLDYEAVGGPQERLIDGATDLVFHRAPPADARFEMMPLSDVRLVPVAAPDFLPFAVSDYLTPEMMRPLTQCVIRDTARDGSNENHFLIEDAHSCSVADHAMKKELILHGMAWGHLPEFLITDELRSGALVSLAGRHFRGSTEILAATRRRDRPHGPVAQALWAYLASRIGELAAQP